jgi:alkanesulfonate monooxygenase SsuD/methylene tetrahydromethanopterin reductase-like flavin-dependent oxidoreductase (luciferase family)
MDYVFCYLSYYGYKMAKTVMSGFWEEMDRLGKDRNPYRAGFAQVVGVAESRQQALDLYTEAAEYFYGRCLHVDPRFAAPPGYVTEATQRAGIEGQVKLAAEGKASGGTSATGPARLQSLARDMQGIVDNGYLIIGSPDEVTEQIRELATTLNVGQLMLLMQFGNLPTEIVKYNTRLFAEKVIPKLRSLFSEWENRWWPKPLERRQRATASTFMSAVGAGPNQSREPAA